MTIRRARFAILPVLALTALASAPRGATAQRHAARCDGVATTRFAFGHTAGNLRPEATLVDSRGRVRRRSADSTGPVVKRIPRDSVRALALLAWKGGFNALPTAPTRPTPNPDAARRFIELRSACGTHSVEYGPGDESPLFRELYARLEQLAAR